MAESRGNKNVNIILNHEYNLSSFMRNLQQYNLIFFEKNTKN